MKKPHLPGLALIVILALPPVRTGLEAAMVGHMLVQLPLLALGGWWCVRALPEPWRARLQAYNGHGLPGILLVLFGVAFWMLPRSLDAALSAPVVEAAKFVTLPMLVGAPLALSWPRLHPVAKGFVFANALSMLGVLGWLYRESPVRLCNFYLIDQQTLAGNGLLILAGALLASWIVRVLVGPLPRFTCRVRWASRPHRRFPPSL